MPSITRMPFGRIGHDSSRVIFGAAALGNVTQEEADRYCAGQDEDHAEIAEILGYTPE